MKRIFAAVLCILVLSGCAGSEHMSWESQPAYTIGVVLKSMDSQHWLDMRSGMNDAARDLGAALVLLYPEEENQTREQTQMFRDLVAMQPDLILLAPCDSNHVGALAALASQSSIPLVTVDTAATDITLPYIGADNERIGRMAATRLAGLAGKTGQLAIISGVETQASHAERVRGFRAALEGYPQIELTDVYHGDSNFRLGMRSMARIMEEHPETKGVFCTNAVMALGAIEQLASGTYKSRPAVVAVDTQDDALAALSAGTLQGLVTQNGYDAGYEAIQNAVARLEGKPVADTVYIGTDLLTEDTVDAFIAQRKS